MNVTSLFLTFVMVLAMCVAQVATFNVPPTGMCFVGSGGDCYRCDCAKPLSCYKGSCR